MADYARNRMFFASSTTLMLAVAGYMSFSLFWHEPVPRGWRIPLTLLLILLSQTITGMRVLITRRPDLPFLLVRAGGFVSASFMVLSWLVLLRDMFQNHMFEMLSLVAMEMPASFEAGSVRDEKAKLLRSIRPFDSRNPAGQIVRAQYAAGNGMNAYRAEPGVDPESQTETYVAAKLLIDNWRWKGVPFYLRSGKKLAARKSEIAIVFKHVPHSIFAPIRSADMEPDTLVLKVQPEEGMALTIQAKQPGPKLCMGALSMDFKYASILEPGESMPEAYERLLLDCMLGDQTLFIRSDTVELAWGLLTPVLDLWRERPETCPLAFYPAGSSGPKEADRLIQRDDRFWTEFA